MLFRLIDEIKVEPFDPNILDRLQLYAEHHFSLEETYMDAVNYPGIADHIKAHNRFREELAVMVETQEFMNKTLQDSLSLFLSEWLKLHVMGIDKKLEAFILESGVK